MIQTSTKVTRNINAADAVDDGVKKSLFDAADKGFGVSQDEVPVGATSGLKMSGYEPQEAPDGSIVWGYTAEYTRSVVEGTEPHWIPLDAMDDLKLWARRVLGNENAAWAVRRKIAARGTPPQDFISPAIAAMKAHLRSVGLGDAVTEEVRSR